MPVAKVVYMDMELMEEVCSIIDNEKERVDKLRLVLIITPGGIRIIRCIHR